MYIIYLLLKFAKRLNDTYRLTDGTIKRLTA